MQFEIASCGFALGSIREFREQVRWADVVHYHFPWPFADLLDWVVGVTKPKIITYQSDVVRQQSLMKIYRPLMQWFLQSADRIVATSQPYVDSSPTLAKLDNVQVIPIGIDESSYPPVREELSQKVKEQFGTDYFFFVGMLRYYKGLHILLEACKGLPNKVVIAGKGPEEERLHKQARDLGLSNVEFLGRVDDEEKMALIENCRAMVFPSHLRSEAFGVTLLEGMMRSKPLICAEVGTGTSFVNQDGETGYVVPANDSMAFRDAMVKLGDGTVASEMGCSARIRFENLFTADRMSKAYLKLYREVIEENR